MSKTVRLLVLLSLISASFADDTSVIVAKDNTCSKDYKVAEICMKCDKLPFNTMSSLSMCCEDTSVFMFCEACVNNEESCQKLLKEMEDVKNFSEDDDDYGEDYDSSDDSLEESDGDNLESFGDKNAPEKRYGKLFVNRSPKRFGKVFFGKRSKEVLDGNYGEIEKRFGRLYMGSGSYFGKRDEMAKRYGRLYMNGGYFGKRSLPSDSDEYAEYPDYNGYGSDNVPVDKRYGRIFLGSGNKMFGKREYDDIDLDKRYGRIFLGKGGMFGKRSSDIDYDYFYPNYDKRFGQLYLGRNRYLSSKYGNRNKRYGRLFTGRTKYLFG